MIIKRLFQKPFIVVSSCGNAKYFLMSLAKNFRESDKADFNNLLNSFSIIHYDNSGSVRNYILKIVQMPVR